MAGNDLSDVPNDKSDSQGIHKSGKDFQSLVFPQDLDGANYYPDVIKFGIYHKQGASYDKVKNRTKAGLAKVTAKFNEGLELSKQRDIAANEQSATEDKNKAIEFINAAEKKKEDEDDSKSGPVVAEELKGVFDTVGAEAGKLTPDKQVITHMQSIFLNMPASLALDESITWEGTDLGAAGAMKSGAGAGGAIESGLLSNMGTILGGAATAVAGPAGAVLGAITAGDTLQAGFESSFRIKANPFKEQTFQGIPFRSFSFEFSLRARTQSEIKTIQSIVQSFRAFSKPSFQDNSAVAFNYPHEFRIEFLTKDVDNNNNYITNEYLPEIKYCVCTKVGSNFGGDTWRTFKRGAPTEIQLSLEFQETELITQEDVFGKTQVGFFKGYKGKF